MVHDRGTQAHAAKAIEILNAYANTLKSVSGWDARLLAGMSGINFMNAAEIVRHTSNQWPEADQKKFREMARNVLYPLIMDFTPNHNGNWDAAMGQTMMAMGGLPGRPGHVQPGDESRLEQGDQWLDSDVF